MLALDTLTHLTATFPGVGGAIKQRPEDFLVEEQPLYDLAGEGEHLFLFIEKTGLTTTDVADRLARAFRVPKKDVGYAGLKDKHAITRQHFSVRTTDAGVGEGEAARDLEHHPKLKVLWADRHRNKLRRGHLAGNRFAIRIRDVKPTDVVAAKRTLDRLAEVGVPNYLGEQRFGYRQQNQEIGAHLLRGEHQAALDLMLGHPADYETEPMRRARAAYDRGDYLGALEHWPRHLRPDRRALDALRQGASPEQAARCIGQTQFGLFVSACQGAIFNRVLDRRLRENTFDRLLVGDLAWKHDNRAVFLVEDQATADHENGPDGRVRRFAVSPSGPMWGRDMARSAGDVAQLETEALAAADLTEAHFADAEGARRPLRVILRDPDISGGVDEHGPYIRLTFELPRGAFATTVLREIMKTPQATPAPATPD
ncbi:MAG: tRNA pseudouridine(13) synthase TruD [Phycisphaeraceae bacterium]